MDDKDDSTEIIEEGNKSVYLFGRDISKVPCFRNSYLYGIYSGFAGGLLTFLLTSRTPLSTHVGVASFATTTLSYWVYCRYNFSKTKFEYAQIKAGLQAHIQYEGTEVEKEVIKNLKEA